MKKIILLLLVIPTFCAGQYFNVNAGSQIDAEEVIVPDAKLDFDDLFYLLVNHKSSFQLDGEEITNSGDYDFGILLVDDGDLDVADIISSELYEKCIELSVDEEQETFFVDLAFIDSVGVDLDFDEPIILESEFGKSIANVVILPEGGQVVKSYIHHVDSTNIRATVSNGSFLVAGEFLDSVLFENPIGEISSLYGIADNNVFLASKTYDGNLNWSLAIEMDQVPNVADIEVRNAEIFLLTNDISGTMLRVFSVLDGSLLGEYFWEKAVIINMELQEESLYLSGWVDTDAEIDLDFGTEDKVLESGNDNDGVLLSYDYNMNLNWVQNIVGSNRSHITHFDIGESGTIYATGHTRGESLFGGMQATTASENNHTLFIAKFDVEGEFHSVVSYGGNPGNNSARNIQIINEDDFLTDIRLLVTVTDRLEVSGGDLITTFENESGLDRTYVYLEVEDLRSVSVKDDNLNNIVEVFPNPSSERLFIRKSDGVNIDYIEIVDMQGRKIGECKQQSSNHIDISSLAFGNYTIRFVTDKGVLSQLFSKM